MTIDSKELSDHISTSNHISFLKSYLVYIVKGEHLPLPNSLKTHLVTQAWKDIFDEIHLQYTEEFIVILSRFWIGLVQKQGGKVSPNFAQELVDIIENKLSTKDAENKQSNLSEHISGNKDTVQSTISARYYDTRNSQDQLPRNITLIHQRLKTELKHNHVKSFLIVYLSLTRFNQNIPLPLSTVTPIIYKKWSHIFQTELKIKANEAFLENLSSLWFSLTNQYGIPVSLEEKLRLYYKLVPELSKQKNRQIPKVEEKKKKGFWRDLFDL